MTFSTRVFLLVSTAIRPNSDLWVTIASVIYVPITPVAPMMRRFCRSFERRVEETDSCVGVVGEEDLDVICALVTSHLVFRSWEEEAKTRLEGGETGSVSGTRRGRLAVSTGN